MNLIWPGRALGVALLIPALVSLSLLVERVDPARSCWRSMPRWPWWRFSIFARSSAPGRIESSGGRARFARSASRKMSSLILENPGPSPPVPCGFATTFPTEFAGGSGRSSRSRSPAAGRRCFPTDSLPKRRDVYVSSGSTPWSPAGWDSGGGSAPGRCGPRSGFIPISIRLPRFTMLARRDRLSTIGLRRSRRLGTDNEFERLRDYIEGDDPRHIDWRATARRRKLTCRAFQHNQSQRIVFLIDCGRLMAGDTGDGLSPLDHAFNAMLLLAHVALITGRPGRPAGLLGPGAGVRRSRRRPAPDQAARAQRAQRLSRNGRVAL